MKVKVRYAAAGTQDCGVPVRQAACATASGQLYAIQAQIQTMVEYAGLDLQQGDQLRGLLRCRCCMLMQRGVKGKLNLQHMDSAA